MTSVTIEPARSSTPVARKGCGAHLWSGQISQDGHHRPGARGRLANCTEPGDVLVEMPVTEVQSHHVDAGLQHGVEHIGGSQAGPSVATIFVRAFMPD